MMNKEKITLINGSEITLMEPEEVLRLPNMAPYAYNIVAVYGIPSKPYTDDKHWFMGMMFDVGMLNCWLSADSLKEAGYSGAKVPVLMETIRRFEQRQIPLKVVGTYRPDKGSLYVDYGSTLPYLLEASDELTKNEN